MGKISVSGNEYGNLEMVKCFVENDFWKGDLVVNDIKYILIFIVL